MLQEKQASYGVSICLSLYCVSPTDSTDCVTENTAAADGTECGEQMWCSNGQCVDEGTVISFLDQQCDGKYCVKFSGFLVLAYLSIIVTVLCMYNTLLRSAILL